MGDAEAASPSSADVGAELRRLDKKTLEEMHARLGATVKHLEESLKATEDENTALKAEIAEQKVTIDTLLGSLGQLKISARNTPGPVINGDTPAAKVERFVRRTANAVAPKQQAVQVSERVGELRTAAEPAAVQALGQVRDQVSSAFSLGKNLLGSMFEQPPKPQPRRVAQKAKQRPRPAPAATAEPQAEDIVTDASLAALDPTADLARQEAERWADTVEATLLLEVQVDIGEGDPVALRVRAADRLSEVAQRFVEEHALKRQFLAPLIAYLRQVEDDADTFPVSTEATLADIYETYAE